MAYHILRKNFATVSAIYEVRFKQYLRNVEDILCQHQPFN